MKTEKGNNQMFITLGVILLFSTLFVFKAQAIALINPKSASPIVSGRIKKSKYARYSHFLVAMARHESNNYTSKLATDHNNIFGMGFPMRRPAENIGKTEYHIEGQYMSEYKSFDQAIADMLLWMDYTNFPTDLITIELFVNALKARDYFADSTDNYLNGMNNFLP